MAAPIVSGIVSQNTANRRRKNSTEVSTSDRYVGAPVDNTLPHGFQWELTGQPVDCTNIIFTVYLRSSVNASTTLELEDTSGRVRKWTLTTGFSYTSTVNGYLQFESTQSGFIDDTDFDLTNVRYFNFLRDVSTSYNNAWFYNLYLTERVILSATDITDQGNFDDFVTNDPLTTTFNVQAGNLFALSYPLQIGDNDATLFGSNGGQAIGTPPPVIGNAAFFNLSAAKQNVYFNISSPTTINDIASFGRGIIDNSAASITLSGWTISSAKNQLELGNLILDGCTFSRPEVPLEGGLSISAAIKSSTATWALDWNGSSTFGISSFSGVTDYYIRIGSDNVSNNATIDVSSVTFGTPGVTHFLIDGVTGIEIATAAGASLTKTEINSGSATFVTPVVTVTLTGIIPGSEVRIFETGTQTPMAGDESIPASTFEFEPTGAYDIRIFQTGYQVFRSVNNPVPSGDVSIQVNQFIDRGYFDAP